VSRAIVVIYDDTGTTNIVASISPPATLTVKLGIMVPLKITLLDISQYGFSWPATAMQSRVSAPTGSDGIAFLLAILRRDSEPNWLITAPDGISLLSSYPTLISSV